MSFDMPNEQPADKESYDEWQGLTDQIDRLTAELAAVKAANERLREAILALISDIEVFRNAGYVPSIGLKSVADASALLAATKGEAT